MAIIKHERTKSNKERRQQAALSVLEAKWGDFFSLYKLFDSLETEI